MSDEKLFTLTPRDSDDTILAKQELLASLQDHDYRRRFVAERVRSSMALQIRALRDQREMSQTTLGGQMGMAQTWISKLESPDYGKMTVATLLRLSDAFDTDLEIKFRPFSTTIDTLPRQGPEYFTVPSFSDEYTMETLSRGDLEKVQDLENIQGKRRHSSPSWLGGSVFDRVGGGQPEQAQRKSAGSQATVEHQYAAR